MQRCRVRSARFAVLSAGAALTLVPLATSASAVASAQCTRLAAPAPVAIRGVRTRTVTLGGCNPPSATGGSGRSVTNLETLVSRTTWAGGTGSTIANVADKAGPTPNNCPTGTHLIISGGKVTGGTGAALDTIKVGYLVNARLCITATFAMTLEPGSTYKFSAASVTPATTTTVPSGISPPPPRPVPLPAGMSACPADTNRALTALVDRDRKNTGGLPALAENANLDWAARKHSIVMAPTSVPSHDGWDTEIAESHFVPSPPYWTGQNIAIGPMYTLALVESGFFDEVPPHDGHRLNILSTKYHRIGIGCIINNSTHLWSWTQDFGS